jgi:hypothetical protein
MRPWSLTPFAYEISGDLPAIQRMAFFIQRPEFERNAAPEFPVSQIDGSFASAYRGALRRAGRA